MARKRSQPAPPKKETLHASLAGVLDRQVPKRWVKFVVGIVLLFPCAALTAAFFDAFLESARGGEFSRVEEFTWFGWASLFALIWFFGFKPLVILYVLGHELTHALLVWLHGGRVTDFRAAWGGGQITTDKANTWIVLAPYFVPFYTLVWLAAYGLAMLLPGVPDSPPLLYAGIGFTWTLHLAFTIQMVLKGQPDLEYGGVFFSAALIYLANLVLISVILALVSPGVTGGGFLRTLLEECIRLAQLIVSGAAALAGFLAQRG
jgi:hypothetical protein